MIGLILVKWCTVSHIFLDIIETKDRLSKDNGNCCPISSYEKQQTHSEKALLETIHTLFKALSYCLHWKQTRRK